MDFKAIAKRAEAKTAQSPTTGGTMDFKAIAERANSVVDVDANAVTDWWQGNVNIANRLEEYSKEERWGNPDADLQSAIESQKQKALDVQRYINVNRDKFADYDALVKEYDNYVGFLRDSEKYVKNQNAVYSAFANRDAYDNAVRINKLQEMSVDELKQFRKEGIAYVDENGKNVTYDDLINVRKSEEAVKTLYSELSKKDDWDEIIRLGEQVEKKELGLEDEFVLDYSSAENTDVTKTDSALMNQLQDLFPDNIMIGDLVRLMTNKEKEIALYLLHKSNVRFNDGFRLITSGVPTESQKDAEKQAARLFGGEYQDSVAVYKPDDGDELYAPLEVANGKTVEDILGDPDTSMTFSEYAYLLLPVLESRRLDEHNKWWKGFTDEQPFWAWVAARGANFLSIFETLGDDATKFLSTGESDRNMFASTAATIDSQNVQNIKANLGDWGEWGDFDLVSTLYGTGSSLGDWALTSPLAYISPALQAVALGAEAYAHAKNAALDRGMEGWQAELTGLAAGVVEAVFEKFSIGKLKAMKKVGVSGLKDVAWNTAKSMVTNASEEALTELANGVYDILANGDFSQFETDMRLYRQQGMTEAEARQKAAENFGIQLGESAASGFLMGLPFGAGASVASWKKSSALGKTVSDVDFLVELGKQFEGTRAHELALEVERGNTKDAKLGALLSEITAEMENAGEDVSNKAVEAAKQNLEQIANGIAAQVPDNNVGNITDADVKEAAEHLGFEASSEDIAAADAALDADEKALDEMESASAPQGYVAPNQSKQVKRYQTAWARNASRALSRNVYFYDGADHDGAESGFVGEDGAIYVNTKSPTTRNSVAIVLGHEYVHTVEGTDEYNALSKAIFESAVFQKALSNFQNEDGSTGTTIDGMIAAIQKQYAAAGRQLSAEDAKTEIVAQFVAERILQDGRTLAQFAKTGWFAQFLVRLRRLLARLASKDVDKAEIVKLERLLQRAVRAAKQNPAVTKVGRGKNAIRFDSNGKKYWQIETEKDIFRGLSSSDEYKRAAYNYIIAGRDSKAVIHAIDGKQMQFIRISAEEFTKSEESQNLKQNDPLMFAQKMRLIPSLGDLASNANINWSSPYHDKKGHTNAKRLFKERGFENYRGRVRIDNVIFNYIIRAGKAAFGDVFYDINLEVDNLLPRANDVSGMQMSTSNNRVPQSNPAVNTQSMQNNKKNTQGGSNSIPFGFSFNPNAKAPKQTNLKSQSVDAQAKRLMELTDAKGDRAEFTDLLRGYYDYMASGHEMTWEGVRDAAAPAVEWLSSHYAGLSTIDEDAREALKETRAVKVRMSADQKAEAAAKYGTYGAYHRKALGTMIFTNDAKITLEERWGELADLYPEYFDASVNVLDMPSKLLDVADELRRTNTAAMEREENIAQVLQDIEGMVHDSYWQVEEVRSEKERYEDRVYDLKKKHRAEIRDERAAKDRAVEEERERGDLRVKKERARAKEIEQRERAWQQVQRERDADRRRRTELKEKIRKKVNKLNTQLLNGTKEKNVKLGLREAVAYALNAVEIIDGEDYDRNLQRRIDYLDQQMCEAVSREDIDAFQKQRDDLVARGDRMKERLEKLSAAYSAILADNDSQMQMYKHDAEMVRNRVDAVVEIVGETPLRYMNTRQLEAVLDMYTLVQTTIDNANKIFKQGKAEDLQSNATAIIDELSDFSNAEIDGYTETAELKEMIRGFSWNELKPVYAFRRLGSERFMELYQEMRRGEDVVARDVQDASEFARSLREKYGWDSWDLEKTYKFKTIDGRTLPLTVPQMMSLYAYSKRPQAQKHLEKGGIMFSDREMYKAERGIFDVKRSSRESWKIDPILINTIAKTLTSEQIHYVNAMQSYLSTTMGEKGNEVARVMWGIDIFKEKNYFPLKSSHDFVFSQSTANPLVSLKSSGMTKQTTPHAANPIILEGFDTVWAEHVVQMSNYHGFVIPIDNMNKVLNYADFINAEHAESVTTVIRSVFGESAVEYIEKLIQDVNGGVKTEASVAFFPQLIGKAKKTAVAFSMSTVVQQPTAILRAMSMIAPKYFVGKYDTRKHSAKWEELKSYAPVAILKEIGGFDTTSSRGMVEWLNQKSYKGVAKVGGFLTDSYYRDDKLMAAATKADEIGWVTIWEAVKREQAKLTKMDTDSAEFLKRCGERFSEVIQYTQVYDSTLSRSGLMRSKSEYMKMATAFMGEPTTSFNMLFDAVLDTKRGASKLHAGRVIGSVYVSTVFAAIAASAVYALRDDDEDEAYLDKWAEQFGQKLSSELWVHNMIPFVRDVASIFDGWDVERMDMALVGDLVNAWNSIDNPNKHWWRKLEDMAGAIGALFGVPAKNMIRTGRELFNAVRFAVDDVAPGNPWEHFMAGFTRTDVLSELEKLNAAIAGEIEGTPYADNPTFAALEDLYDEAVEVTKAIEDDDTLTDSEKLKKKAEVNPSGLLIKPTVGSSWALEDGSLLSNNEELKEDVTALLETLMKLGAEVVVKSEEYSEADTAERVKMVEDVYSDMKSFAKGALAENSSEDAVDAIANLVEMLNREKQMRDPDVVDALATVKLKDENPLGASETLAKMYPTALAKLVERVKRDNGNRFEYTEDGEEYVIYLNRASDEELEVYEEKMEARARSILKKIYAAYDPDELEKLLKSTDPYTLYKRIK